MSNVLRTIKNKIREIHGYDHFSWFDSSYIVDWVLVVGVFVLGRLIKAQPVYERDFYPDDPLIGHPHKLEQISSFANKLIAGTVAAVLVVFIGGYRNSVHEIHHGLLAAAAGSSLNDLITEALKNRVGRLRPDFLSRCEWDLSRLECTGDPKAILDGRKSFPSGHASSAFVGMIFVTLFLAGKTAALCFGINPRLSVIRSRFARLGLVLSPLYFAIWVAVTRVEDNRHHREDVIVGGVIGIFSGTICYLLYWPNPFSASSFSEETMGRPRLDSVNRVPGISRGDGEGYRLAPESADFEDV
ncbi:lipid phosphate phosphatase 1 [Russula earlei]|uniref:Lipid phosphate phosphatase 1 n=1 Tax=Russula earlei TaxID=71964 RepID=A0ACC0U029_9AGAM|nr:lipid phosphate phosphatase 1 [Russula earlei]